MIAPPDLARKFSRAATGERGVAWSAAEVDLLVAIGVNDLIQQAAADFLRDQCPPSTQRECHDCAPWCYLIQAGDAGPIKIGLAKDVNRRRSELQTGHAETLHIRAKTKDFTESDLHRFYEPEHLRGEWHRPSPRLLAFIEHLSNG